MRAAVAGAFFSFCGGDAKEQNDPAPQRRTPSTRPPRRFRVGDRCSLCASRCALPSLAKAERDSESDFTRDSARM